MENWSFFPKKNKISCKLIQYTREYILKWNADQILKCIKPFFQTVPFGAKVYALESSSLKLHIFIAYSTLQWALPKGSPGSGPLSPRLFGNSFDCSYSLKKQQHFCLKKILFEKMNKIILTLAAVLLIFVENSQQEKRGGRFFDLNNPDYK